MKTRTKALTSACMLAGALYFNQPISAQDATATAESGQATPLTAEERAARTQAALKRAEQGMLHSAEVRDARHQNEQEPRTNRAPPQFEAEQPQAAEEQGRWAKRLALPPSLFDGDGKPTAE